MADQSVSHAHDQDEAKLELDYEQTLATWRMLVDLRFRLLAFVPAIAGVLVALAGRSPSAASALVAVLGLTALFGIIMYDLRNSQFHDAASNCQYLWIKIFRRLPAGPHGRPRPRVVRRACR